MFTSKLLSFVARLAGSVNPTNGAMDVNIQDQATPPLDLYFVKSTGTPTTLTADAVKDEYTLELTDATAFPEGTYLGVFSGTGRYYFAEVLSVAVNQVTLDTPIDFEFPLATSQVLPFTREMNVDGSGTPQIFSITAGSAGLLVDTTRIMFAMTHGSAGDDGLFGNLAKLTRGVVLRLVNGVTRNYFNVKDNGEIGNLAYDLTYTVRSGGLGTAGTRSRYTWAGPSKHGVVVRLAAGDTLDVWIQDDLTGLDSFRMLAAGHEADE